MIWKIGADRSFLKVFVPCNLAIFGAIVFERLGWVVGEAGLGLA